MAQSSDTRDSAADARARIERLATTSKSLSSTEASELAALCESGKDALQSMVRSFVHDCDHQPARRTTMSDGTPIAVSSRVSLELSASTKVRRSGKQTHEFQVGCSFYRYFSDDGEAHTKVMFRDLVPMVWGKTAAAEWAILQAGTLSLRDAGHRGPVVEHYCWDGRAFGALTRLAKASHRQRTWEGTAEFSPEALSLLEFVVTNRCSLHIVSKALEWAMFSEFQSRDLLRDVFVSIESVRQSYNLILLYVGEWVSARLQVSEDWDMATIDEWKTLWVALGVEPEVADLLSENLQLRFVDGRLLVARSAARDGDIASVVRAALLAAWKITSFVQSRWLTVGHSSQGLVAALLLGMSDLIDMIFKDPKASKFHLGGWRRLTADGKLFLAMCSVLARLLETPMLELMEDSRLMRKFEDVKEGLFEEHMWLVGLPPSVWERLGSVCGWAGDAFRSRALRAAAVAHAFVHHQLFNIAGKLPWSLTMGDLRENLRALKASERPQEQVASQLWDCLHLGMSEKLMEKVLFLIRDVEWSTLPVEQMHASAAQLMRHHPEYGADTLGSRSFVNYLNRILPRRTQDEKAIDRDVAALEKARKGDPGKISARHMYLRDLLECAAHHTPSSGRDRPHDWHRRLMKKHGKLFQTVSQERKLHYARQASMKISERFKAKEEHLEEIRSDLEIRRARIEEERRTSKPAVMSEAALTAKDLEIVALAFDSGAFKRSFVQDLRRQSQCPPEPWGLERLQALREFAVWEAPPKPHLPWLRHVCLNRQSFASCAFLVGNQAWMFQYATQNPHFVAVCPLESVGATFSAEAMSSENYERLEAAFVRYRFLMDIQNSADADDVLPADPAAVEVLDGLTFEEGCCVASRFYPVPLQSFMAELPETAASSSGDAPRQRGERTHEEAAIRELPWLARIWNKVDRSKEANTLHTERDACSSADADGGDMSDGEVQAIYDELERRRRSLAEDELPAGDDFRVGLLGGAWTMRVRGVAADAVQARAANSLAQDFCRRRGLAKTARFEISSYGEANAAILARAWCHRLQYYYDLEVSRGGADCVFDAADRAEYVEPTELTRLHVSWADSNRRGTERIAALRLLLA